MKSNKEIKDDDLQQLPKHFDANAAEEKFQTLWNELGVYRYDATRAREETFIVDTPPPTVSGSLHVGHVFSYTHTDIIARYQRMLGKNIFYPMGWDDNGLPTERRVQNYFHVRCDPAVAYEENLEIPQATAKIRKKPPRILSRPNFLDLCVQLTREDEQVFKNLWQRLGLSVDWNQEYSTIDKRCRTLAQLSFLDLFNKAHVYSTESPTMWDVDFQTAIAQAEVEDRETPGAFHDVRFGVADSEESFIISTTRPELLPACVGVTFHPDDDRYRHLEGKKAITPLFFAEVPCFPSKLVDPEKGTGILMVCTFGDQTDVQWWREHKLALRQIVQKNGRLGNITFGEPGWESRNPESANRFYAELSGKKVAQAKTAIVELLRDENGAAAGTATPLVGDPKPIKHAVRFYEKGDKPLEFISTRQWFVRILDKKEQLMAKGNEINWFPGFMRNRYLDWTQNLNFDWCISRQRYFGVSFPVWYPLDEECRPDYSQPIVADEAQLPVDPSVSCPAGYTEEQRDKPNGFTAENDVFDTWFTSSLSPQIGSHWQLDNERHKRLFPMDLRPQSHEIIRTWAFYTIVKAMLHEDTIPWKNVTISGWVLDPDRKKMSKSKGNVVVPTELMEKYSSDTLRYWAGSARLGVDTACDEKVIKIGKRLVTKLYNAAKFVLSQQGEAGEITCELDRAFVQRLKEMVRTASGHLEKFDFSTALSVIESFFWNSFTDTYLEFSKKRAWGDQGAYSEEQGSALAALQMGLEAVTKMFAPYMPYICEEVWSWRFAGKRGIPSVCIAPWPQTDDYDGIAPPEHGESFDVATVIFYAVNKQKTDNQLSIGRQLASITVHANAGTIAIAEKIAEDIKAATRCDQMIWTVADQLEDGQVELSDMEVLDKT